MAAPANGMDFNCTIQELKQTDRFEKTPPPIYFNCTIQELKLSSQLADT